FVLLASAGTSSTRSHSVYHAKVEKFQSAPCAADIGADTSAAVASSALVATLPEIALTPACGQRRLPYTTARQLCPSIFNDLRVSRFGNRVASRNVGGIASLGTTSPILSVFWNTRMQTCKGEFFFLEGPCQLFWFLHESGLPGIAYSVTERKSASWTQCA